jgi:MFS family permease
VATNDDDAAHDERAGWTAGWRLDLTPLRASRQFRLLTFSGTITYLGNYFTYVALLLQVKQLTGSALAVGGVGLAELLPTIVFGLWGGAIADAFDRRRVVVLCESALALVSTGLLVNSLLSHPQVWAIYLGVACYAALDGVQRPSLDAIVPRVVAYDQLPAASAISSLRFNAGAIVGPSIGGVVASYVSPSCNYAVDLGTYVLSLALLVRLRPVPAGEHAEKPSLGSVLAGLRYAAHRPELLGTYAIDMAAMAFAMPIALFPFLATRLHAPWSLGLLYAAASVGSVLASLFSGWTARVHRHGLAICAAAATWGAAIACTALTRSVAVVLAALVVAGMADMVSGQFRAVVWNQTIPSALRGRLAGVELLSYSIGPSVGQFRAGVMAAAGGVGFALGVGGLLCVGSVGLLTLLLPGLRRYDVRTNEHAREVRAAFEGVPLAG